jgi:hypothetical protein
LLPAATVVELTPLVMVACPATTVPPVGSWARKPAAATKPSSSAKPRRTRGAGRGARRRRVEEGTDMDRKKKGGDWAGYQEKLDEK